MTGEGDLAERVLGSWSLVALRIETAEGPIRPLGDAPSGVFHYCRNGRMFAHLVADDGRRPDAPEPPGAKDTRLGDFAYAGWFRVEGAGLVHEVDIASAPDWADDHRPREVAFEAGDMILTLRAVRYDDVAGDVVLRLRRDG